jgi:hypothetical protein
MRDDEIVVAVYTRNGGGNRDLCYEYYECHGCASLHGNISEYENTCCGYIITHASKLFPNFIGDEDDDFDCTYATMYFSILPEYVDDVDKLVESDPELLELPMRFSEVVCKLTGY